MYKNKKQQHQGAFNNVLFFLNPRPFRHFSLNFLSYLFIFHLVLILNCFLLKALYQLVNCLKNFLCKKHFQPLSINWKKIQNFSSWNDFYGFCLKVFFLTNVSVILLFSFTKNTTWQKKGRGRWLKTTWPDHTQKRDCFWFSTACLRGTSLCF